MNLITKIFFTLIVLVIGSCAFDTNQDKQQLSIDRSVEVIETDSMHYYSGNYKYAANVNGKVRSDTMILRIKILRTVSDNLEQYQKRDSILKEQNRSGEFNLDVLDVEPIDVDLDNPIRDIIIKFVEDISQEDKPLFEGIYLDGEAKEMYIPTKGITIKF